MGAFYKGLWYTGLGRDCIS